MLKRPYSQLSASEKEISGIELLFRQEKSSYAILKNLFLENRYSNSKSSHHRVSTVWLTEFIDANEEDEMKGPIRPVVLAVGSAGERVSELVFLKLSEYFGLNDKQCALRYGTIFSPIPLQTIEVDKMKTVGQVVGPGILYLCSNISHYATEQDLYISRMVHRDTPVGELELMPSECIIRLTRSSIPSQYPAPGVQLETLPLGQVGLINLPNSGFINSSLQALLHIPQFVSFFSEEGFSSKLNRQNPHGCMGKVGLAFCGFLRHFYSTKASILDTTQFMNTLSCFHHGFSKKFLQDSYEFTAFILECLHQDLARCDTPSQFPMTKFTLSEETTSEVINEAAQKSWKIFKEKCNSYIHDTMMGMKKKSLQCPVCKDITTILEPFIDLSLEIPGERNILRNVVIMLSDVQRNLLRTRVSIPQTGTISEVKAQVKEIIPELVRNEGDLIACEVFDGKVCKFLQDDDVVSRVIEDCDDMVLYEISKLTRDEISVPCFIQCGEVGYALPFFINVSEERLAADHSYYTLHIKVQTELRLAQQSKRPPPVIGIKIYQGTVEQYNSDKPSDKQVIVLTGGESISESMVDISQTSSDFNTKPKRKHLERPKCGNSASENTHVSAYMFADNENTGALNELAVQTKIKRDINNCSVKEISFDSEASENDLTVRSDESALNATVNGEKVNIEADTTCETGTSNKNKIEPWKQNACFDDLKRGCSSNDSPKVGVLIIDIGDFAHSELKKIENIINKRTIYPTNSLSLSPKSSSNQSSPVSSSQGMPSPPQSQNDMLSLHGCLRHLTKSGPPGDQDLWYCRNCQEFQIPTKKLELWKTPDILLIHLQRFPGLNNMARKIEDFVDFPLTGLDLSAYISEQCNDQEPQIYDLLAVNNHFGGGDNHYTCMVKDPFNQHQWLQFSDSFITPVKDIVTNAGYMLYYAKRSSEVSELSRTDIAVSNAEKSVARLRTEVTNSLKSKPTELRNRVMPIRRNGDNESPSYNI